MSIKIIFDLNSFPLASYTAITTTKYLGIDKFVTSSFLIYSRSLHYKRQITYISKYFILSDIE